MCPIPAADGGESRYDESVLLLRRSDPSRDVPIVLPFQHDSVEHGRRVRCPRCHWEPAKFDRWICTSQGAPEYFDLGCGTAWNTFDTHGQCPGCRHQWQWTSCLACHEWSPHEEWYEDVGE